MDITTINWLEPPPPGPDKKHLNCCQKVLVSGCDILGVSPEQAERMGAYFGGGMRCGGTCGPVNAALLILGQQYGSDPNCADCGKDFLLAFADAFGSWMCSDIADEQHANCDAAIAFTEDYLQTHGRK